MKYLSFVALVLFLPSLAKSETPKPLLALKGLDPVALAEGKEVPGLETLEIKHGLFRYRFASRQNQAVFAADPQTRGIQFGGACGKMGPFSGNGSPDRFLVHGGRIYIFASEGCRNAFRSNPEKHIETPNPVPEGTAQEIQQGAQLVLKALEGFGGAEKVDAVRTFQEFDKNVYKQGTKETIGIHTVAWEQPDRFRVCDDFGTKYGYILNKDVGIEFAGKHAWTLDPGVRDVARRQVLRQPLAMLQQRSDKSFVAIAKGQEVIDGSPVEKVSVALHGATTTWSIESKSGRILEIEYQARNGIVGTNVVKFSDFRAVDGLVLPFGKTRYFNGKKIASPEIRIDRYVINGSLAPATFELPQ